jgi:hypothetical protein
LPARGANPGRRAWGRASAADLPRRGGGLPEVQVALWRDFGCRGSGHLCCRGERRGRGSGRRRGVRCRDGWTRLVLRTGDERFRAPPLMPGRSAPRHR